MATATRTRKKPAKSDPVRTAAKAAQSGKKPRREVASAPVNGKAKDPLAVNTNDPPASIRPKKSKPAVAAGGVAELDIAVSYGGVSIGKQTARLGLTIERKSLNVVAADEAFCNRRLHGKVLLGDDDGTLFEKSLEVLGVFDVKGFRATSDAIGVGLTFQMNEIDIATLAKFSKGGGRLVVDKIAAIPHDAPGGDGDEEDDEFDE